MLYMDESFIKEKIKERQNIPVVNSQVENKTICNNAMPTANFKKDNVFILDIICTSKELVFEKNYFYIP